MTLTENHKDWIAKIMACLIIFGAVLFGLSYRFEITFNTTKSLGYHIFITDKRQIPSKHGQFVKFQMPTNKYFKSSHWTKRIVGVPGDVITVDHRMVFINGKSVGYAKPKSASGKLYYPIEPTVIPEGYYYLQADHLDSYDSRYKSLGLIHETTFLGRDYPVI
ncbi:S26 family signal peptidase [Vibrio mediterranei]|uniref:signal peptidase I n=1 Tax=Vibrio mediterranei TaxID=689 RepID=A0ABX5D6E9_9VIBR|nr:S26 family signal peptidase [Vibrio mediterranei]PRQ65179.1 peptidase S26 [Vibrio mediterranei]